MEDTIYRQQAIDAMCDACSDWCDKGVCKKVSAIQRLPSAQPEQRWIPCSEKLPLDEDYDETFTVTIQCEHYDGWDDYVTGYADWTPHGWDIQSYYLGQIKVVAWMSLPEPYGDESDE